MITKSQNRSNRRQKKLPRPAARALLGVEQLEKREVLSATVYWTGDAGTTNWNQAGNWSTVDPLINNVSSQILPGPTDNVIIDLAGVTVEHSAGSHDVIGSLQVIGAHVTLNLSAGTLDLSGAGDSGTFQVDQAGDAVHLWGGALEDATVSSNTTIVAGGRAGILDGVTLDGTLNVFGASVTIKNGLVLNGVIDVVSTPDPQENGSTLTFDDSNGSQSLSGLGHIDFGATVGHLFTPAGRQAVDSLNVLGGTLTIAGGITINGPYALASVSITGSIDNFGNIDEDSGGVIAINFDQGSGLLASWTNSGSIEVSSGTLELGGPWTNNGAITASSNTSLYLGDGSVAGAAYTIPTGDTWVNQGTINTGGATVYLGGILTQAPTNLDPAALGLGADTVYLVGALNNVQQTLTLTPGVTSATGSWTVSGGLIDGGTIDATAVPLVISGGTLDGVTLDGTLHVLDTATIRDGLVLNGVIELGSHDSVWPSLTFDDTNGPQTLSTTSQGAFVFECSGSLNITGSTLTIAAGVTIKDGFAGSIPFFQVQESINGSIDNFGNIEEDLGGIIAINYEKAPGATYAWQGLPGSLISWTNNGTIEVSNGTLQLGGPWTNNGAITASSNTSLFLGDSWVQNAVDPNPSGDAWVNNGTITTGGGTVYLGGNLTPAPTSYDPALLGLGTDTVYLMGSLNNTNHTLTLAPGVTSTTGNWTVWTGQIDGGTVDETAATLTFVQGGAVNGATVIPAQEPGGSTGIGVTINPLNVGTRNQTFIANVYADLLKRGVESGGLAAWSGMMDQGVSGAQVVAQIQSSSEYRTEEVNSAYEVVLHRQADPAGVQMGLQILATSGLSAEYAFLAGSQEYQQTRGGSAIKGWLNAIYVDAFNRSIDSGGEAAFTQVLSSGAINFQQAADIIFTSPEFDRNIVGTYYTQFLGRSADSAGLASWVNDLQSGQSLEKIIAGIVGSSEYFNRTGTT